MNINLLTAKPALELMLASNGLEAPYPDPQATWNVFVKYLAVPAEAAEDAACFQISYLEPMPGEQSSIVVLLARQLTDAHGETRSVQLQYSLGDLYSGSLEDSDVWSSDFQSVAEFAKHVESLPEFQLLLEDSSPSGELFLEFIE